jgi:hypothetical protein
VGIENRGDFHDPMQCINASDDHFGAEMNEESVRKAGRESQLLR